MADRELDERLRERIAEKLYPDPYLCAKCKRLYIYIDLMGDPACACGCEKFIPVNSNSAALAQAGLALKALGLDAELLQRIDDLSYSDEYIGMLLRSRFLAEDGSEGGIE